MSEQIHNPASDELAMHPEASSETSDSEVLVLNGPPGSGKSTLANAIAEILRNADQVHAVIDLDELARVHPESHGEIMWDNLAAIWKNYKAIQGIKVILPVCIDDKDALEKLREAVPCDVFTICELKASIETLKARVTEREPNEYWRSKLRNLAQTYEDRTEKFADFQVDTESSSPTQTARNVVGKLGWC